MREGPLVMGEVYKRGQKTCRKNLNAKACTVMKGVWKGIGIIGGGGGSRKKMAVGSWGGHERKRQVFDEKIRWVPSKAGVSKERESKKHTKGENRDICNET